MELRQLEYFVAVAEEASFTRAAERVHISQSGVSAQIRALEAELGTPLIDRSGRVAKLTGAGTQALTSARAALAAAAEVRRAVEEVLGVVRGRLALGMVTGCTITPLFDALAAFRRAHPGVELAVSEGSSDRLLEQVRRGALDLALVGSAGAPTDLQSLTIVSEGLVAVVPEDHPLAARPRVRVDALDGLPLICMPVGTGVREVFDRACAQHGLQPDMALQASAPGAVLDLALRGLGVAIVSESMAAERPGLHAVALQGVSDRAVLALAWREGANPALGRLLDCCRVAFGLHPAGGGATGSPRRGGSRPAPGS